MNRDVIISCAVTGSGDSVGKKQFIQFVLLGPSGIINSNDYEVGILCKWQI